MSSPILFLFVKNLYCPFISRLVQKTCPLLRMCSMFVGLHLLEAKADLTKGYFPTNGKLDLRCLYPTATSDADGYSQHCVSNCLKFFFSRVYILSPGPTPKSLPHQPFADQTKRGLLINAPLGLLRDYIFLKELQRI